MADWLNSDEFRDSVLHKADCIEKYSENIERLFMHPNNKMKGLIKIELVKFISEYNQK
jgi:hypothetical protein